MLPAARPPPTGCFFGAPASHLELHCSVRRTLQRCRESCLIDLSVGSSVRRHPNSCLESLLTKACCLGYMSCGVWSVHGILTSVLIIMFPGGTDVTATDLDLQLDQVSSRLCTFGLLSCTYYTFAKFPLTRFHKYLFELYVLSS